MCGSSSKKDSVNGVSTNLRYIKEDVSTALSYASTVGDPELTKQLTEIQDKATSVQEYIAKKTDAKQG